MGRAAPAAEPGDGRRRAALAWGALLLAETALGGWFAPGGYQLTRETLMPHMEENLRQSIVREQICLDGTETASLFTVLEAPALAGCSLQRRPGGARAMEWELACEGTSPARGTALLERAGPRITARLEVKMGGKNMTFAQRVTAVRTGDCDEP